MVFAEVVIAFVVATVGTIFVVATGDFVTTDEGLLVATVVTAFDVVILCDIVVIWVVIPFVVKVGTFVVVGHTHLTKTILFAIVLLILVCSKLSPNSSHCTKSTTNKHNNLKAKSFTLC